MDGPSGPQVNWSCVNSNTAQPDLAGPSRVDRGSVLARNGLLAACLTCLLVTIFQFVVFNLFSTLWFHTTAAAADDISMACTRSGPSEQVFAITHYSWTVTILGSDPCNPNQSID